MTESIDLTSYNPDEIPEGKIQPAGTEIRARIMRVSKDLDKNGTPYIMPWMEDADDPNVEDFNDYLPMPGADETEKENGRRLRRLRAFGECFDIDLFGSPVTTDEMKGKDGYVIVGVKEGQDGNPANNVKQYLARG